VITINRTHALCVSVYFKRSIDFKVLLILKKFIYYIKNPQIYVVGRVVATLEVLWSLDISQTIVN
jgi:hypothetical protein